MVPEFESPFDQPEPGAPAAGRLPRLWTARDMVVSVATVVVVIVVIGFLVGVALVVAEFDRPGEQTAIAIATIFIEGALGLWVVLVARFRGIRMAELGFARPRRWGPLWVAWAGSYIVLVTYQALLLFLDSLGLDTSRFRGGNQLPVDASDGSVVLLLLGVAVVGLAPLCEELFFRGLLFRGMRGYWTLAPSMLVSGLLFGVFHQNIGVLLPFTLIGVLFAWSNEQSGSILTSIAAHGAVNTLSFALTAYGVNA